jgi:hypothetical protein
MRNVLVVDHRGKYSYRVSKDYRVLAKVFTKILYVSKVRPFPAQLYETHLNLWGRLFGEITRTPILRKALDFLVRNLNLSPSLVFSSQYANCEPQKIGIVPENRIHFRDCLGGRFALYF